MDGTSTHMPSRRSKDLEDPADMVATLNVH